MGLIAPRCLGNSRVKKPQKLRNGKLDKAQMGSNQLSQAITLNKRMVDCFLANPPYELANSGSF